MSEPESTTCPQCHRTSYNPNDVRERYCGACHQYYDMMAVELTEALLASARRFEFNLSVDVDDSRFRSAVYQAAASMFVRAGPPLAHYSVDVDGRVTSWVDEVIRWERSQHQAWGVGDLRDAFGELVPQREPAPCGWHCWDGFRVSGAADVVPPLPPVEGGWPLW